MDSNPQVPQSTEPVPTQSPAPAAKPEVPSAVPVEASPGNPAEKKGGSKWLYIAVIVMGILALALVGYIAYTEIFMEDEVASDQPDGDDMDGQEADTDLDIEEEEDEGFVGDYVTADLPEGWTIEEYFDGDGTDMVMSGVTYTGLTGLEIINPDGDMVFKIKAVDGIGGVETCEQYIQFSDYSVSDYNDAVAAAQELGGTSTLVDYTTMEYSEFVFLGTRFRRVEKKIYWDSVSGEQYFEPGCGLSYGAWQIEDATYTQSGVDNHSFMWELASDATDEELVILDGILGSVEKI